MAARKPKPPEPTQVSVLEAIDGELAAVRRRDAAVADSALAASLRVLAAKLDNPATSPNGTAMCAKALHEGLDRLRELAPPAEREDELGRLRRERAAAAGMPAPADRARSTS